MRNGSIAVLREIGCRDRGGSNVQMGDQPRRRADDRDRDEPARVGGPPALASKATGFPTPRIAGKTRPWATTLDELGNKRHHLAVTPAELSSASDRTMSWTEDPAFPFREVPSVPSRTWTTGDEVGGGRGPWPRAGAHESLQKGGSRRWRRGHGARRIEIPGLQGTTGTGNGPRTSRPDAPRRDHRRPSKADPGTGCASAQAMRRRAHRRTDDQRGHRLRPWFLRPESGDRVGRGAHPKDGLPLNAEGCAR